MSSQNGDSPTLDDVRAVLERDGKQPVLIYVNRGSKIPAYKGWRNLTYAQTQTDAYQRDLCHYSNTAVVLGGVDNLCPIDCDTKLMLDEMLSLNPAFASSLITRGERGGQIWLYVTGNRPKKVEKLKVGRKCPIAFGAKESGSDGRFEVGEFRAEGGASIIRGIHPCGCCYIWLSCGPIITVDFDDINWPEDIIIPWGHDYRRDTTSTTGTAEHDSLLKRAIATVTIDRLWEHFGFEPRGRVNPVRSPFRDERNPSFSVYDEGRRWKDHGNGEGGDSFDFYQRATNQDASAAFVAFIEFAGLGDELKKNQTEADKTKKIDLILPSSTVEFEKSAEDAFPVLAKRHRYFVRDRLLIEIAYQKPMKDKQLHDVFHLLDPDAFRSRLEKDFNCLAWREKDGVFVLKPSRCSHDAAKTMLKTDEPFKHLPAISYLSSQPVYTVIGNTPEILYRGYHDIHGGIYVSHGDKEHPIILPELKTAVDLILGALKDYDFVSPSDKSRAVASLIGPALRTGKFLGDADFPIDISEADESQSGKTYRLKMICAIYGETPYIIANREGGVGSLDESISSALIAGVPFILFENFRGYMNSQLVETCLRGFGTAPARIPHRGEVQVSTTHINWQLSSNGMGATGDFVNRAVVNRISKHADGFRFTRYAEGDILAHIRANQTEYLGAVFRIVKQWHNEGCWRTNEDRHNFVEWAQTLDWIVQNIFDLAPLLDGHTEEVLRISDPALSWLRQVAIAVDKDNRLDEKLLATEIVDICQARGIDFPNNVSMANLDQVARYAGRVLGRLFRETNEITVDRYKISREITRQYRPTEDGGDYSKTYYVFEKRIA
jgi:hypothetical protein